MVAFVQQARQSLPVCEAVDENEFKWGEFDQILEVCQDAEAHIDYIDENIVLNGVTITKELIDAFESIRSGNWKESGEKFGTVLALSTIGKQQDLFLY